MTTAAHHTPMTTIKLYGALRQFGREYRMLVGSTAEAIKALCVQIPGLERFLANAHLRGMEFAVFRGKRNISEDELQFGAPRKFALLRSCVAGSVAGWCRRLWVLPLSWRRPSWPALVVSPLPVV